MNTYRQAIAAEGQSVFYRDKTFDISPNLNYIALNAYT